MRDKEKTADSAAIRAEIEDLPDMTVGQFRLKHIEVFGEESRSNHKQFLFRRIAWRIQANAWGGLSERALRRNDRSGYRIATSVGGSATGEGGDRVVCDDPHNVQEA